MASTAPAPSKLILRTPRRAFAGGSFSPRAISGNCGLPTPDRRHAQAHDIGGFFRRAMAVAQPAMPADLAFEPHRVARLVRRVDQNDAVGCRDEAVIRSLEFGFDEYVGRQLLHRA